MAVETEETTALLFDYNGFATQPYVLRRMPLFPILYTGDALTVWGPHSPALSLHVPPNALAVVSLINGKTVLLPTGRHGLGNAAPDPVSAQFVSLQVHSFEFNEIKIHTRDRLLLDMDLRVTVQVIEDNAAQTTRWQRPEDDIKAALMQALVQELGELEHEACQQQLPLLLAEKVRPRLDTRYRAFGLALLDLNLTHFHPDKRFMEILQERTLTDSRHMLEERQHEHDHEEKLEAIKREKIELAEREKAAPYRRYVQQLEAQADEDVFAMKQPMFRRDIMGKINTQLREWNQEARLESIKAVGEVAKALIEDLHRHPGMRTTGEIDQLEKALALIKELSEPTKAPPIPQQTRSKYAVDPGSPKPPALERPADPGGNGHHA
jgi:hypothetical protein